MRSTGVEAARLAVHSTPSEAHTLWDAIARRQRARLGEPPACRCTSSIMSPESGPGSSARNGEAKLIRGSRIARTGQPAISDGRVANAARSASSAAPSSAAWKLPVGNARPS